MVYLDNALPPCGSRALKLISQNLSGACGSSSHYSIGYEAKRFVDTSRARGGKTINTKSG